MEANHLPAIEVWEPIGACDGHYEVSSIGRIRRTKTGRVRQATLSSHGYHVYCLKAGPKQRVLYAHDLVAAAFLGQKPPGMTVNHISGVKTDNAVPNLEYVTRARNAQHAHDTGLCNNRGQKHGMSRLTEEQVLDIRRRAKAGERQAGLCRAYGITSGAVCNIVNGKAWRHLPMP